MTRRSALRRALLIGAILAICAGGGFIAGRVLRPRGPYTPQAVRTATARLSFVPSLRSIPGLPVLATRP